MIALDSDSLFKNLSNESIVHSLTSPLFDIKLILARELNLELAPLPSRVVASATGIRLTLQISVKYRGEQKGM